MRKLLPFLWFISLALLHATNLENPELQKFKKKFENWRETDTIIHHFAPGNFSVNATDRIDSIEKPVTLEPHHQMKVLKVESLENSLKIILAGQFKSNLPLETQTCEFTFNITAKKNPSVVFEEPETRLIYEKPIETDENLSKDDTEKTVEKVHNLEIDENNEDISKIVDIPTIEDKAKTVQKVHKLEIDENTVKLLQKPDDKDENVYVVSMLGATRAGKSWFCERLRNRFETKELGHFVDADENRAITKGMNIATVKSEKFGGKILLIDSEGMDSLTSSVDERLLLITSMISDQLVFIAEDYRDYFLDRLSIMAMQEEKIRRAIKKNAEKQNEAEEKKEQEEESSAKQDHKKNFDFPEKQRTLRIIFNKWNEKNNGARDPNLFERIDINPTAKEKVKEVFREPVIDFVACEYKTGKNFEKSIRKVEGDVERIYENIIGGVDDKVFKPIKMSKFLLALKIITGIAQKNMEPDLPSGFEKYCLDGISGLRKVFDTDLNALFKKEEYQKFESPETVKEFENELNSLWQKFTEDVKEYGSLEDKAVKLELTLIEEKIKNKLDEAKLVVDTAKTLGYIKTGATILTGIVKWKLAPFIGPQLSSYNF